MLGSNSQIMKIAHTKFKMLKAQFKLLNKDLSKLWSGCLKWAWKVAHPHKMVDVWVEGVQDMIKCGALQLVQGERVLCGANADHPSLYVSHTDHTIHLIHWQGSEEATKAKYKRAIEIINNHKM